MKYLGHLYSPMWRLGILWSHPSNVYSVSPYTWYLLSWRLSRWPAHGPPPMFCFYILYLGHSGDQKVPTLKMSWELVLNFEVFSFVKKILKHCHWWQYFILFYFFLDHDMLHSIIPRVRFTLPSSIRMASGKAPVQYLSESTSDQRQTNPKRPKMESTNDDITKRSISPIGYIKSCFKSKNGTPRQPSVCTFSRAKLTILKSVFQCPDHSLQGLEAFSHVW